jgi:hypothetical protein
MTKDEFERLILKEEGETLDFKREQYELIRSTDEAKAKFVKDIISLANTVRTTPAHIIIGIESMPTGKTFLGLNKNIDDAIFQDQVKTRVYPIPQFSYETFIHNGKEFGIIEIPLRNYPEPIAPIVSMKGLEIGRIYMRRGSTNSEATGKEILAIDKWIKHVNLDYNIKDQITNLIKQINSDQSTLSYYISAALEIASTTQNKDLLRFCHGELMGWYNKNVELNQTNIPNHRKTTVMASIRQITSVTNYGGAVSSLKNELLKDKDFNEINYLVQFPITEIEATIQRSSKGSYLALSELMKNIFPGSDSPTPVYMYIDIDAYIHIYNRTKTELINLLIRIGK